MLRRAPRLGLLAASVLATLSAHAAAQSGPGLPNLVYPESELFTVIQRIGGGNHGHVMMHDGYLATFSTQQGVVFFDVSNPYQPRDVSSIPMSDLNEAHTHAQTTAWGGQHVVLIRGGDGVGGTGFAIWDWSDIFNPQLVRSFDLPGVPGGYATGVFWLCVQAPYIYATAGPFGTFVVDASDPLNPVIVNHLPTSETGNFNVQIAFAVGNLLIITNSNDATGFARLDISDPVNPMLMESTRHINNVIPYGAQVNGGLLLIPAAANNIFQALDLDQPGFPVLSTVSIAARGGSAVVQDQFIHVAASIEYLKIDASSRWNYTVTRKASLTPVGGDLDWVTPLGNFVALGSDEGGFATSLVPHQSLPDSTGPSVTMVNPPNGARLQALTSRVGITMSDVIEQASIDGTSFTVRPVGGSALTGSYTNQFGIVNFSPDLPLQQNTTYEVEVGAGGMRDLAGNAVPTTFISRFTTGSTLTAIIVEAQVNPPAQVGQTVTFDVTETVGPGLFQYSWDFGDGSPPTPFSSSSSASHTYAGAGHYSALVTVTNGSISGTDAFVQTMHHPVTPVAPSRSSTIALDETLNRVWCVNADNDTITAIEAGGHAVLLEVGTGDHPRTLAVAPDGTIWVVCQDDASIEVHDPIDGQQVASIPLPYASAPYGIAMSPDGSAAWVTLRATGELAMLDPSARSLIATVPVGPDPKGIAIAADSERIYATRFRSSSRLRVLREKTSGVSGGGSPRMVAGRAALSEPIPETGPAAFAEVYEVSASRLAKTRSLPLALDPGPDTEISGRGLPNYLNALAISPDGRRLRVPSKKDNILRGQLRNGLPLDFDNTVRTIVSQIDLPGGGEDLDARIDLNDHDMAFAVAFSPIGDYAFHVIQGSNAVDVRDVYTGNLVAAIKGTGLAPQGLVLKSDGSQLFVHNFMSRTVSVYDISGVTSSTAFVMPLLANVSTVANETLAPDVLQGKQIFYNAADPRMNEDGYLSCATCHLDGGDDGMTWDFTDRGEGLRNTTSLEGRSGTGHGNVHWTANFDEIQDFENDIRGAFGGDGFMSDAAFNSGTVSNPLGQPKAGISAELDALSAYVSSLTTVGLSPHRNGNGTLTAAGQAGKLVFQQQNCAQCHSGAAFTDSAFASGHDVGTIRPRSGQRIGGPLTAIDTPTLRGLWNTAPYLHDGSAQTLMGVLRHQNGAQHGGMDTLTLQERKDLVQYLLQIDDLEPAAQ